MLYMVTFTINIPQMLAYIPYMDPMGMRKSLITSEWNGILPNRCWFTPGFPYMSNRPNYIAEDD